MIMGRVFEVDC